MLSSRGRSVGVLLPGGRWRSVGVLLPGARGTRGASPVAQLVKNLPAMQETLVQFLAREDPLRNRLTTPVFLGFPGDSDGKESACNEGDPASIPGWGRPPGGGCGNPLQYSCLKNPYGQRSLEGCSPWGRKESDATERLSTAQHNLLGKTAGKCIQLNEKS